MGSRHHRPEVAVKAVTRTARAVAGATAPALFALVTAASLGMAQGRVDESDTTKAMDASVVAASVRSLPHSSPPLPQSPHPLGSVRKLVAGLTL